MFQFMQPCKVNIYTSDVQEDENLITWQTRALQLEQLKSGAKQVASTEIGHIFNGE